MNKRINARTIRIIAHNVKKNRAVLNHSLNEPQILRLGQSRRNKAYISKQQQSFVKPKGILRYNDDNENKNKIGNENENENLPSESIEDRMCDKLEKYMKDLKDIGGELRGLSKSPMFTATRSLQLKIRRGLTMGRNSRNTLRCLGSHKLQLEQVNLSFMKSKTSLNRYNRNLDQIKGQTAAKICNVTLPNISLRKIISDRRTKFEKREAKEFYRSKLRMIMASFDYVNRTLRQEEQNSSNIDSEYI